MCYSFYDTLDIDLQQRNPLAKSLLYHLRELSPDAIGAQFDGVRTATFAHARRRRAFTRLVDVALDIHEWIYSGSDDTPHVCSVNPDRGTDLAYAFVTLCIVDPAVRFTLAAKSVEANDSRTLRESIHRLVATAREFVEINRVYCDRGFYRVPLAERFVELDLEFVLRAPQTVGVNRVLDAHDVSPFVTEYELVRKNLPTGRVPVTLVVLHRTRDDDSFCLVTNRVVSEDAAEPLAEAYRRWWGIEPPLGRSVSFCHEHPHRRLRCGCSSFCSRWRCTICGFWCVCSLLSSENSLIDQPSRQQLFRLFVLSVPDG